MPEFAPAHFAGHNKGAFLPGSFTIVPTPPIAFLADVYRHLPFLVVHITTDGVVLHCNPETCLTTGYDEQELLGRNIWAVLFPGKLFAQVPKFISLAHPSPLLKDVPMTIRTKQGAERVIGFSRYVHAGGVLNSADSGPRTFICVGVDLTDRLINADRAHLPQDFGAAGEADAPPAGFFGPHIGNAGAIDSEIVTPIAISPKAPRPAGAEGPSPIDQVREGIAQVETHMNCVQSALNEGEAHMLAAFGESLRRGNALVPAVGLMNRGEWLHAEITGKSMSGIRARVDELLAVYKPQWG